MLNTQPEMPARVSATLPTDPDDFSLVRGGALFRLWRRTRLSGDAMQFTRRRVLAVIAITWVPLLVLSILEGHAWGSGVALTFLQDVETHVRLLIAAPLLLYAEVRVHRGIPSIVREFVITGLVPDAARPRFDAAIASALRLRNSVVAELLLLAFVYAVGIPFVWRDQVALDVNSWYATAADGRLHPFAAGWWAGLVAMPVFQFLCLRWYFRMLIWARFMWQVSRIPLKLEPLHPDGTAGLHFLALSERAYRPVLLGLGTVLAGMMANRIFYTGAKLLDFKVEIVGTVALLTFAVLGPLLFFWQPAPRGAAQGNRALSDRWGSVMRASSTTSGWAGDLRPRSRCSAAPTSSRSRIFATASSWSMACTMVPFSTRNIMWLAVAVLAPVAPLLLTTFSVEELVDRAVAGALLKRCDLVRSERRSPESRPGDVDGRFRSRRHATAAGTRVREAGPGSRDCALARHSAGVVPLQRRNALENTPGAA